MNIYLKAGHGLTLSRGASAIIDESTENRKVKDSVLKYLRQLGHNVTDVTQDHLDADTELVDGVSRANNGGAELFVSIHFNKAFNHYDGALGTESWVYSRSDNIKLDEEVAGRITMALSNLGFKNRGIKESAELYELRSTKMASVIVEVCFVEATEDVALYQRLGADLIGKHIAYAISNKPIIQNAPPKEEKSKVKGIVIYSNDIDRRAAEYLADGLGLPTIYSGTQFDYTTVEQSGIYAVGGSKGSYTGYLLDENFISGSDRYETVKKVLQKLGRL